MKFFAVTLAATAFSYVSSTPIEPYNQIQAVLQLPFAKTPETMLTDLDNWLSSYCEYRVHPLTNHFSDLSISALKYEMEVIRDARILYLAMGNDLSEKENARCNILLTVKVHDYVRESASREEWEAAALPNVYNDTLIDSYLQSVPRDVCVFLNTIPGSPVSSLHPLLMDYILNARFSQAILRMEYRRPDVYADYVRYYQRRMSSAPFLKRMKNS